MAKPLEMLRDHSGIFVKQTRKGCVQELMGCEATNEFKIFPNKDAAKDASKQFMYSLEESTCFMRQCFGSNRSFTQTVWSGSKDAKGSGAACYAPRITHPASRIQHYPPANNL